MRALICDAPGSLSYVDRQKPELAKDQAIIRIRRIGICGTDLHAFEGTQPYFSYPRILGHELSGELIEFDNAPGFKNGETVTFLPYFNCGHCVACRNGKSNCCAKLQVFGVHVDGGMMEYVSVPSHTLIHGEGLSEEALALVEPLSIGAHGVRRAGIAKAEFVLVIGAGPIGLGTMEFARIAGANVIAMDVNEQRLNFCKNNLNIEYTVNAATDKVYEQLFEITNGDMPTVIIDATGNVKAINNAFQYMSHGGRYVLIGLQKENIIVSHPEFHKREATLMSSRNATSEDFSNVIHAMKQKRVNPLTYITHKVMFDEVKKDFAAWLNPSNGVIKAMVEMEV